MPSCSKTYENLSVSLYPPVKKITKAHTLTDKRRLLRFLEINFSNTLFFSRKVCLIFLSFLLVCSKITYKKIHLEAYKIIILPTGITVQGALNKILMFVKKVLAYYKIRLQVGKNILFAKSYIVDKPVGNKSIQPWKSVKRFSL